MMCEATSLQKLDLRGTMNSLAQLPDIHDFICNRTRPLTINLTSISGPCDCSVQWMADAAKQSCSVELQTSKLECGLKVHDLNLTCPRNGMILYQGEDFNGTSFIVDNMTTVHTLKPIRSIAVLGEQAWILNSSVPFGLTAPYKILLPGRYANLQEADEAIVWPLEAEPHNSTLSATKSSPEEGCNIE